MQIVNLYKYIRDDGGVTVSPVKPNVEYVEMFRLIADEGKELVNGDIHTSCIDVETTEGWTETEVEVKETKEKIK